jgi:hypothetical protein
MPDLEHVPQHLQRRELLAVIEDQQQQAWKKLRDAAVPEEYILALMPRIRSYCLFALNEFDLLYLACEEMSEREGRSVAHQRYFNDKLAFVLRSMEASIADLLALAIRQPIDVARKPPAREVITPPVYVEQSPPAFQTFLLITLKLLLWLCAFPASLLLGYELTGSEWWQLLFPLVLLVLWILFRFSWWGLIFPVTAVATVLMLYTIPAS